MTTKEEKARLTNIAMELKGIAEELMFISGSKKEKVVGKGIFKESIFEEKPEPKGGDVKGPMKIGDLNIGDEGIIIEAEILEIEKTEGKAKETGRPWRLATVMLSDKTGPIKLKLWNDQIEQLRDLQINDVIRVEAWKVEKGYKGGVFELVYGQFGTIEVVDHDPKHIM